MPPGVLDGEAREGGPDGAITNGLGFGMGGAKFGRTGGVFVLDNGAPTGGSGFGATDAFGTSGVEAAFATPAASFFALVSPSSAASPDIGALARGELRVGLVDGLPTPRLNGVEGAGEVGIGEITGGEGDLSGEPGGVVLSPFSGSLSVSDVGLIGGEVVRRMAGLLASSSFTCSSPLSTASLISLAGGDAAGSLTSSKSSSSSSSSLND